MRQTSGTK